MTISKGQPWGVAIERPSFVALAASDAELAAYVEADRSAAVGVSGGDVFRALGRPSGAGARARRLPMDIVSLRFGQIECLAVAHVVVRRHWLSGPVAAIMNVGTLGRWDVAPASHPNDGRAELVQLDGATPLRARLQIRSRLPTGSHVPHPQLTIRSRGDGAIRFEREADVWVDGVRRGRASEVRFAVDADAYELIC